MAGCNNIAVFGARSGVLILYGHAAGLLETEVSSNRNLEGEKVALPSDVVDKHRGNAINVSTRRTTNVCGNHARRASANSKE